MKRYIINRGKWVFDYAKEGLWNYPSLSNEYILQAQKKAEELKIKLYLPQSKDIRLDKSKLQSIMTPFSVNNKPK